MLASPVLDLVYTASLVRDITDTPFQNRYPQEAVRFFYLPQVNEETILNLKTRAGKEISREELTKPTDKSLRDKARREQQKARKQLEIDKAARQLFRHEVHVVLTESAKELEMETATRPGEFPSTTKKKGEPAPP